jgi:hypothetical protein
MNIKNAKKKLREVRFFLNHMIEQERKAGDEEPFDFYLSAFLSAGMSVRDAFHIEQDRNRNNAIKAWKKVWEVRLTPEEKRLYDFMREDRKHEVHRSGSSCKAGTENRELGPGTHSFASGTMTLAGPPGVPLAFIPVRAYSFTIAGTERQVTEACSEYLTLLERMVADFKAAHCS